MAARKVIVAGAGVLGLSCALALADAGFEVALHDPAAPGDNASGVAAGMIAPGLEAALDVSARPHFDILTAARDLWPAFAARAGIELDRRAALAVGRAEWIDSVAERLDALGVETRTVGRDALAAIAPGNIAGLEAPGDWRVDARQALAALRRAAAAAGVAVHSTPAPQPEEGLFIAATGASQSLTSLVPELAALSSIKGHILQAEGALDRVLRGEGVYAAPTTAGLLVGATMEQGRSDRMIDPLQVEALREAAARLLPGFANAEILPMVGVRAATADGLPLVGPSSTPGVLIAAGARRNGWLLAPLVAQTVTAWATGGEPGPWKDRLAPSRFSPRG